MTLDRRAKKLAEKVVDYSLSINSSDVLLIRSEDTFEDFAYQIASLAKGKGAEIMFDFFTLAKRKEIIERNNKEELRIIAKHTCDLAEIATAAVRVDPDSDPDYLVGVDPKKIADYTRLVRKPIADRICGDGKKFKGIKWNLVAYPCEGDARNIGMTLREYKNFLYSATLIDWTTLGKSMNQVKSLFDNAEQVRMVGSHGTDISLSLSGRCGQICAGKFNMPDGEVFYGPVEDSANGHIHFPYEYVREGQRVSGIDLEYKNGEVIRFSARKGEKFLESMLNLNGAKRIGEFGIGCNPGIARYTKNLLFDEKIGGTIHLAIGESYAFPLNNGGGNNKSDIHWDLVCDLRPITGSRGGQIYVDGNLVQSKGAWIHDMNKYYDK